MTLVLKAIIDRDESAVVLRLCQYVPFLLDDDEMSALIGSAAFPDYFASCDCVATIFRRVQQS